MATRRKTFTDKQPAAARPWDVLVWAELAACVLDGSVKADRLVLSRQGNGKLKIEYDDPGPDRPGAKP